MSNRILAAFILGCLIGGMFMAIVTGLAIYGLGHQ